MTACHVAALSRCRHESMSLLPQCGMPPWRRDSFVAWRRALTHPHDCNPHHEQRPLDARRLPATDRPRLPEPKGGSGKTTATILLAGEFANAGLKTLIIDADPQASASIWKRNSEAAGYRLDNITVERITDKSDVADRVRHPQDEDIVLVDIQGTANDTLSAAARLRRPRPDPGPRTRLRL